MQESQEPTMQAKIAFTAVALAATLATATIAQGGLVPLADAAAYQQLQGAAVVPAH
jgi:hypothetical protein